MPIALMVTDRDLTPLKKSLQHKLPNTEIIAWPDMTVRDDIEFVVVWRHPEDMWKAYPNIKVAASLGAGVDQITQDSGCPQALVLTRIVDEDLAEQMAEYVLTGILMAKRRFPLYNLAQQRKKWVYEERANGKNVTVLGAGHLGLSIVRCLARNGFTVSTWSQSKKCEAAIAHSFTGDAQLLDSVKSADYVVAILPSTPATDDVINQSVFDAMPMHAQFINVGRGNAVDEKALLHSLTMGNIAGAIVDVFKQEPLPKESPLWQAPNLIITPHISAITNQENIVNQIVDNYHRFKANKPLKHQVERKKGY
ncbi:2-hydroxyacid dehydrogenase [Thalassotalea euphylliae]|uniref:2-hydroxyacid dehydrogenase n=1 Tax=Thalassotalea euphylliae TaxID=1655234 RepID=UPI003644CC96